MGAWQATAASGVLVGLFNSAFATGVDAPVEGNVAVKAEMIRGRNAALECSFKTMPPWISFAHCLDHRIEEEKKSNTLTDPYKLAFYDSAYTLLESMRIESIEISGVDPREDQFTGKSFLDVEKSYYAEKEDLKKRLGISDDDLCQALSDSKAGPTGKCKERAPPP